jgi:hypothetical protein
MPAVIDLPAAPPRRTWLFGTVLFGTVLSGLLVIALALIVLLPPPGAGPRWGAGIAAGAPRPTLFQRATDMLNAQAHALETGDEKGWTAAVDPSRPALRAKYRMMFRSLRALGITKFAYRPEPLSDPDGPALTVDGNISYCFNTCSSTGLGDLDAPDAHQQLTIERSGGRQVITDLVLQGDHAPWEDGPLVVRRGSRATVAAPASEAKNLDRVLGIAERAARLNDRFAVYLHNPQTRYRVYLADERAWDTWYGGLAGENAVGYALPISDGDVDVVIRMAQVGDDRDFLPVTIRHEMGHVITLGRTDSLANRWLAEGIAEWIGWWPNPARTGPRLPSVRSVLFSSAAPATIALPPLDENASSRVVDAFYGLGQLAVDCLARTYGQAALFDFVKGVMQEGSRLDDASRRAFNRPFPVVDRACVSWIRDQTGT